MDHDPYEKALRALSRFLVAEASLGDSLREVAELTVDALPGAELAGVTMLDEHDRPGTTVCTDPLAPEIDGSQYESGRGPCLDAWRHRRTTSIPDLEAAAHAYPEFAAACAEHGIRSTLALPLLAAGTGVGALNLYSSRPHAFTAVDEELGTELAAVAGVVLANAAAYWGALELGQQLDQAMQSRSVIEQAKGILMARTPGIDPDGAFDLLRRASQRGNLKLREVAQRVVDQRDEPGTLFDADP